MEKVINLGIPHVGELIFEIIDTHGLSKCLEVSETWRELAENVLIKRWKGKMLEACKSGETKVVQLLLERCNSEESGLNIKNEKGTTALMSACFNGHNDVVELLLGHSDRNIDLNARNNHGFTAFMFACYKGQKDVVKLLMDHSEIIELNARNDDGVTAFVFACYKGHKDVVKLLLDHSERIELNAKDDNGDTAFVWACSNGQKDVVKLLLDHYERIDLNTRDDDLNGESHAYTALMIAHRKGHQDIVQMVKSKLSYSSQFRFLRSRYVAIDLFLFVILFFAIFCALAVPFFLELIFVLLILFLAVLNVQLAIKFQFFSLSTFL